MRSGILLGAGLLVLAGLTAPASAGPQPGNVLMIVADDVGMDVLSCYGEGVGPFPPTPTICSLARDGVRFRNAWAYSTCSPSRATVLTGRYGFRNGVGANIGVRRPTTLPDSEVTLPETLSLLAPSHESAGFGKWHLGNCLNGGGDSPVQAGFAHFAGAAQNIRSYFDWLKIVDGVQATCSPESEACPVTSYTTSVNVDDTLTWIQERAGPWFAFLAFNAPHQPFQAPPDELHSYHGAIWDDLPVAEGEFCPAGDERPCYLASVEAMDREIGRLLGSLDAATAAETTVIFVGDNGTPGEATVAPFLPARAKGTIYEGGINVPLIINGPLVANPGRESRHLVSLPDLFPTVLEIAGVADPGPEPGGQLRDGVSLVSILQNPAAPPVHQWVYSERFGYGIMEERAVRDGRFKLIDRSGQEEYYDLRVDPFEQQNLLLLPVLDPAPQMRLEQLRAALDGLFDVLPCEQEVACSDCGGCASSGECTLEPTGATECRQANGALLQCDEGLELYAERCTCDVAPGCLQLDSRYLCL